MTLELFLEKKLSTFSTSNYPHFKKFQYSGYLLLIRFWHILHGLTVYLRVSKFLKFIMFPRSNYNLVRSQIKILKNKSLPIACY